MPHHKPVADYTSSALAALQALSQPEQLVAAFFNASNVGLAVCDEQLRFQVINETLATMNGVPPGAHLGRTVRDILGQAADVIERIMRRVFRTGRPAVNVEVSVKLPTRAEVGYWIENYFPIKASSGKVMQVGAIVVEVTEQRKLEESLRRLTRMLLRAQDEEQRRIARLSCQARRHAVPASVPEGDVRRQGVNHDRADVGRHGLAVHRRGENRRVVGRVHDDPRRGHAQRSADVHLHPAASAHHRQVEGA